MAEVIVSVHIEKTGGTSEADFLAHVVGSEGLLLYDAARNSLIRNVDKHPLLRSRKVDAVKTQLGKTPLLRPVVLIAQKLQKNRFISDDQIPEAVKIIHGHFTAGRFDHVLDNPIKTTLFREPLERTVSHFLHWRRMQGNSNWRVLVPYDPQMTFTDFAFHPMMVNYQTQAVDGNAPEEFALVGITEHSDLYAAQLFRLCLERQLSSTRQQPEFPRMNKSPESTRQFIRDLPATVVEQFKEVHASDYHLYTHTRRIVQAHA